MHDKTLAVILCFVCFLLGIVFRVSVTTPDEFTVIMRPVLMVAPVVFLIWISRVLTVDNNRS